MARLLEYQGKRLLEMYGIKIPNGFVASTFEEASEVSFRVKYPVMVKAQIHITGRFKAGGIKIASNNLEVKETARSLLGSNIRGFKVDKILIEEKLDVKHEFYLGLIVNDSYRVRAQTLIFSIEGGVDIEEVASRSPEKIRSITINPISGFNIENVKKELSAFQLSDNIVNMVTDTACKLFKLSKDYDATIAEINPLVLTSSGELVAADCRITIDDNSLYRHPEIKAPRDIGREFTEIEKRIWSYEENDPRGTGYFIQLVQDTSGCVGFHGIGGGGAMLAADALIKRGIKIANYADTSGDPPASKVYRVVKAILSQPGVVGYVLIGSTLASQEQWHHGHAIVKALNEMLKDKPGFPVVILLAGNKEAETHEIIRRGLKDLPIRLEIYGRDYIYETDFIADRVKELVDAYLKEVK
ncbi:MAG: ATP-grasp domain-containing protein [Candidatus Methanomethylicia archaeon]